MALWNHIFALRSAGHELVTYEPRRAVPWGARDVALVAVVAILLQGASAWIFYPQGQEADTSTATEVEESPATQAGTDVEVDESAEQQPSADKQFAMIVSGSCGTLLALVVGCLWLRAQGATASDLGFGLAHTAGDFKLGVAGFVVASIPVFVMQFALSQLIPYKHPVGDIFQAQPSLAMIVATAILAVVIAPLTEEFFFRVVLQGWLESLYAQRLARYSIEADAPMSSDPVQTAFGENAITQLPSDRDAAVAGESDGPQGSVIERDELAIPALGDEGNADTEGPRDQIYVAHTGTIAHDAKPSLMPVLLSSFVFALVHLEFGPSAIPLFFFALILGYLYRQTHRLLPSVVTHASLNALSTFIMITADK